MANPADLHAFGVLRRARIATDQIPSQVHAVFSSASGAQLGLSRRVEAHHGIAWVIPGKGSMCLMSGAGGDGDAGAGCAEDKAATAGYLEMEEVGSGNPQARTAVNFVSGLVPDGVAQVTLHLLAGGTKVVPVHENVYMQEVEGHVISVTFTGPNGPMKVGAGI